MICLVNPRSARWRYRVPLSVLSIGASIEGIYDYEIVDGNLDPDIFTSLPNLVREKGIRYVGFTVMPGPQLEQAILLSRRLREEFPSIVIIWGGYFPTLHTDVVLRSQYVDFVIRDQGDHAFRRLISSVENGGALDSIAGLSYKQNGIRHNERQRLIRPEELPPLPYHKVDLPKYIGPTYLGSRTINYHSSVGCPFLCGFCAVAASYRAGWAGLVPERIVADLHWLKNGFGVNAVEFHDNNFFTSEKRTAEFADRIRGAGIAWWGEARPDTLMAYDDRTWRTMSAAGCKMIFMGAESGSQHVLKLMDKGGTQTPETIMELAVRMRTFGVVPEFSFVLGSPTPTVEEDIENDIRFIMRIKEANPEAEIIIYIYSPVQFDDADIFRAAQEHTFHFPEVLDDWLRPEWMVHDLKKNPVTPWLRPRDIHRIRNFERVLNAKYPTVSDLKIRAVQRKIMGLLGGWRYRLSFFSIPFEVRIAQRIFRYRQPEIEGF